VVVVDGAEIEKLKKIGLNEYEARAYASLVSLREATAREILQCGNIPQGRVYDILKGLASRGFVEILEGNPTYYRAIDPSEVIRNLSSEYSQVLQQSMDTLKSLHIESTSQYPLWVIHNEQAIINRIFTLLRGAKEEVIIFSNNPPFFQKFTDELQKIQKQCKLHIIVDDPEKFTLKNLNFRRANDEFFYIMGDIVHEGVVYRNILSVIIDRKESFDVVNIGTNRIGVVSKLPVLSYIITRWLEHLHLLEDE
jgi:HTH-type transcriptional regulator, sugar sensing transcriptional regulator